jgi:hypothetical protein
MAIYRQSCSKIDPLNRELFGFRYDCAQSDGCEEDESPESESTKTRQDAARELGLISVHNFCRTPKAQPLNPVSCRIHPHQADAPSGVKRGAEETDYHKNRE